MEPWACQTPTSGCTSSSDFGRKPVNPVPSCAVRAYFIFLSLFQVFFFCWRPHMRLSMAGRASLLAMALHVSVLVPTAMSARSATAKCAAFVSISAESMGLGCCRIGKCAAVDKQRSALTMLSPPWATKPTPTIGGERMSPLRLRGGSLIEHCLPAVIRRRLMPTRTCFTRANAVLLDRDKYGCIPSILNFHVFINMYASCVCVCMYGRTRRFCGFDFFK